MEIALVLVFVAMGFAVPGLFCFGFYLGFCYSEDIFRDKMLHIEKVPGFKTAAALAGAAAKLTETDSERKRRIMAENVENFGTDIPQKDVE